MRLLSILLLLSLLSACNGPKAEVKIIKFEQEPFGPLGWQFAKIYYTVENKGTTNFVAQVELEAVCEDSTVFSSFGMSQVKAGKTKHEHDMINSDRKKVAYIRVSDISLQYTPF